MRTFFGAIILLLSFSATSQVCPSLDACLNTVGKKASREAAKLAKDRTAQREQAMKGAHVKEKNQSVKFRNYEIIKIKMDVQSPSRHKLEAEKLEVVEGYIACMVYNLISGTQISTEAACLRANFDLVTKTEVKGHKIKLIDVSQKKKREVKRKNHKGVGCFGDENFNEVRVLASSIPKIKFFKKVQTNKKNEKIEDIMPKLEPKDVKGIDLCSDVKGATERNKMVATYVGEGGEALKAVVEKCNERDKIEDLKLKKRKLIVEYNKVSIVPYIEPEKDLAIIIDTSSSVSPVARDIRQFAANVVDYLAQNDLNIKLTIYTMADNGARDLVSTVVATKANAESLKKQIKNKEFKTFSDVMTPSIDKAFGSKDVQELIILTDGANGDAGTPPSRGQGNKTVNFICFLCSLKDDSPTKIMIDPYIERSEGVFFKPGGSLDAKQAQSLFDQILKVNKEIKESKTKL